MDHARIGLSLRVLRRRRKIRQRDLAAAVGVSQPTISRAERGELRGLTVATLEAIASELGVSLDIVVRWRGEGLDRLLDETHAGLVDQIVGTLSGLGWEVATEVSFNIFGERGSVDVVAWHPPTRMLLVVEAKSVVPDVQATLTGIDRKQRLGRTIVRDRGWRPVAVSRLLVIAEHRTPRRRVDQHAATFASAFPVRGVELRRWLRKPASEAVSGLWFLPVTREASAMRGDRARERVRVPREGVRVPRPSMIQGS
jgi:putative transcriptional regulator